MDNGFKIQDYGFWIKVRGSGIWNSYQLGTKLKI